MKVRYKVGNLGDLIKHFWLLEILSFLKRISTEKNIVIADTFCGFEDYEIEPVYAARIANDFAASELYTLQKPYLQHNKYAGSVTISRLILGETSTIHIFDTNPKAIESFKKETVSLLPYKSGYDILEGHESYDLIFLDPYDDFWNISEDISRKISSRVVNANILLFTPFKDPKKNEKLLDTIDSSGIAFINGVVENTKNQLDSDYKYGMLFFPANKMPDNNFEIIAKRLITVTEKIRRVINH